MDRIYVSMELGRDQQTSLLISSLIRYAIKGYQLSAALAHGKIYKYKQL
jgi:hypothetical protein